MVGIRIEGTQQEIEEIVRRLKSVATVNPDLKLFNSKYNPELKLGYLRCYLYEQDTLFEQLEACTRDCQSAEIEIAELKKENAELRRKLGEIPQPRPYDAVLGGQTQITRSQNNDKTTAT